MRLLIFCSFLLIFTACKKTESSSSFPSLVEIPNSCISGGEPNLFVSETGEAYLSWIEYQNDTTDALLFSKLEKEHWSKASTIATGHNWFVNWADFPSIVVAENGKNLAAHWLQKSASGTYDYDIRIVQSLDHGKQWSPSFVLHDDGIAAEHGFVTLIPVSENRFFATWLDGRNTKTGGNQKEDHGHGHGHGGAMSLRAAEFDTRGEIYEEVELDEKVCDCCQTDAAMTSNGPIVVYRGRTDEEVRDIYLVRKTGPDWIQPRNLSNDGWHITGCPVNGPSIITQGDRVAVVWFTAANEQPMVKVVFSDDAGISFSESIIISDVDPIGRVDIIFKNKKVYLSWMEKNEEEANIMLAEINPADPTNFKKYFLVKTAASRDSGFPILEKIGDDLLLAWTEVDGEETRVRTGVLSF